MCTDWLSGSEFQTAGPFLIFLLLFQMRFVIVLINEHDNEDHNFFQKRCERVEQFRDCSLHQAKYYRSLYNIQRDSSYNVALKHTLCDGAK